MDPSGRQMESDDSNASLVHYKQPYQHQLSLFIYALCYVALVNNYIDIVMYPKLTTEI